MAKKQKSSRRRISKRLGFLLIVLLAVVLYAAYYLVAVAKYSADSKEQMLTVTDYTIFESVRVIDKKTKRKGVGGKKILEQWMWNDGTNKLSTPDSFANSSGSQGYSVDFESPICKDSRGWYFICFTIIDGKEVGSGGQIPADGNQLVATSYRIDGKNSKSVTRTARKPLAKSLSEIDKFYNPYGDRNSNHFS